MNPENDQQASFWKRLPDDFRKSMDDFRKFYHRITVGEKESTLTQRCLDELKRAGRNFINLLFEMFEEGPTTDDVANLFRGTNNRVHQPARPKPSQTEHFAGIAAARSRTCFMPSELNEE